MALKPRAKIALAATGIVVAVGATLAVVLLDQPKKKKGNGKGQNGTPDGDGDGTGEPPPLGDPPPRKPIDPPPPPLIRDGEVEVPGPVSTEPVGGWESRWQSRPPGLFEECRDEVGSIDRLSWSGAFTEYTRCVARKAFPETAARLDPKDWPAWLRNDAMAQIRVDLNDYLVDQNVSNQGWTFMLWLRFDGVIEGCYEALAPSIEGITHCAASEIYPERDWPPEPDATWENDFWEALMQQVEAYVDIAETGGSGASYEMGPLPGPAG